MESGGVPISHNAAYELTVPLEDNLYDYISPMDVHQAVKPPPLPKERESGYVISGLYQATAPKDIEDGYVIPSLEMSTVTTSNSNRGRASFLAEDRDEGYVIANLYAPLQTALPQNNTNEATFDLSLPSAAQKGENTVSRLATAAPQLPDSKNDRKNETNAKSNIYNLVPDSLPHKITDEDILALATTASHDQLLDEEMVLSKPAPG